MKVLLYTEGLKFIDKSGLGKAIEHQMKALELAGIEYTLNPKDDYDIIHINTWFLKSFFMAKKAKRKGKKVIYHAHTTEEDFKGGYRTYKQLAPLVKKWLIKCYSLGDIIITPTEYSKSLLLKYKGLENKKIYAISNGIDIDYFKKNDKYKKKFRKEYKIKDNEKVIIGLGIFIDRKGIVDFVNLAKRFPKYKFIWFGHSPFIFSTFKVQKAMLQKPDNLAFPGYINRKKVREALNGCDLFLMPTYEETEGIPIIEACSCKTKILTRDIDVWNEDFKDKENIYLASTIDEFENKIDLILNDKVKDLTEEAYKVAEKKNIKNVSKLLKKAYEEVMYEK